ncbi:hypothetical protein WISP_77283 [Willisornis vidua]|uniref:Rna-directed dna polymerase from mobile element jockey-like n=1 Tax=Willisornis vidua TaxID=1566151 RepID=A0ABQ9DAB2_9PASS|nr:hypothetical protein WISP_77283 [Willisornis vidua]
MVVHLNRPEKWAYRNLMKFKIGKCKVLHLGRNNHLHQYVLRADQLENSFLEKELGILVDTKLNMSQLCALAGKIASGTLGIRRCVTSQSGECSIPSAQHWLSNATLAPDPVRSQKLSRVSTWMGDLLGIPGAVGSSPEDFTVTIQARSAVTDEP